MSLSLPGRTFVLLTLVSHAAACATTPSPGPVEGPVTVVVVNDDFDDVLVDLVRDGVRVPLGSVAGLSRRGFRIPARTLGASSEVRLVATSRSISGRQLSMAIPFLSGARADWRLLSGLHHSVVEVAR